MITLEVDGMKVEAATELEARKQLAKLVKAAKERDKDTALRKKSAGLLAQAMGYRILCLRGKSQAGELLQQFEFIDHSSPSWSYCVVRTEDGRNSYKLCLEGGDAVAKFYDTLEVVGALLRRNGYVAALFVKDRNYGDGAKVICWAIGADGDQWDVAECPGITPEMFQKEEAPPF